MSGEQTCLFCGGPAPDGKELCHTPDQIRAALAGAPVPEVEHHVHFHESCREAARAAWRRHCLAKANELVGLYGGAVVVSTEGGVEVRHADGRVVWSSAHL
jgi:hypothetical protein